PTEREFADLSRRRNVYSYGISSGRDCPCGVHNVVQSDVETSGSRTACSDEHGVSPHSRQDRRAKERVPHTTVRGQSRTRGRQNRNGDAIRKRKFCCTHPYGLPCRAIEEQQSN